LIEGHHSPHSPYLDSNNYLLLLRDAGCDGVDSGFDKGAVTKDVSKQAVEHTFISTAFGYEVARIDLSQLADVRNKFAAGLSAILQRIQRIKAERKLEEKEWEELLYGAAEGVGLRKFTEEAFRHALGETRRSANDVTLWDHSFSVASMYKAKLAEIWVTKPSEIKPQEFNWRILRISFDGVGFLSKVHKASDILGRKGAIEQALDRVRRLLEVKYPLGNEIYRDENGSAFIVPDREDLLQWQMGTKMLEELIKETFYEKRPDKKETGLDGEISVSLEKGLSLTQPSRGAIRLGELLEEALPPLSPEPQKIEEWWRGQREEICTVCQLRPVGPSKKTLERKICEVCDARRGDRSRDWTEALGSGRKNQPTIWLDEVSDINGRVALIVGQFNLKHWLDGWWLNSLLTQSLNDWQEGLYDIFREFRYAGKSNWEQEVEQTANVVCPYDKLLDKLELILKVSKGEIADSNPVEEAKFWLHSVAPEAYDGRRDVKEFVVAICKRDLHGIVKTDPSGEPDLDRIEKEQLAFLLWRKHPSFARLRRIWETAKNFWKEVEESLIPQIEDKNGYKRIGRLSFTLRGEIDIDPFHAYEAVINGREYDVVWSGERFLIVDNLKYLGKIYGAKEGSLENERELLKEVEAKLRESKSVEIYEPSGYRSAREKKGENNIEDVAEISVSYLPFIPLLSEPQTFMALIPAELAFEVVQEIKRKYEAEFSKVRNRLPLTLGLIFFPRKTPLYAVIDAGWRMLRMPAGMEEWTVKESREASGEEICQHSNGKLGNKVRYLKLENSSGKEMKWLVSYSLGDPDKVDCYYPYFCTQDPGDRKHRFRSYRPTENGDKKECWLVHVAELKPGDKVYIATSHFDFEFLDSTARRMDISYGENGLRREREGLRGKRPYYLEDIDLLAGLWDLLAGEGKLTTTQIKNIEAMIGRRVEEWRRPIRKLQGDRDFLEYVRSVLINIDRKWWEGLKKGQELLIEAACDGTLFDVLELYMRIMKRKPAKEKE
jgi:CRISPR-associated Csx11 family protein